MKKYLSKWASHIVMMCTVVAFTSALIGCLEKDIPFIEVNHGVLELSPKAYKEVIEIKTNTTWNVDSDAAWCRIIRGSGSLAGSFDVAVDENLGTASRNATVTITGKDCSTTIIVRQAGSDVNLEVSEEDVEFYKNAESQKILVFSNHTWSASSSKDWCTVSKITTDDGSYLTISVTENNTGNPRSAIITVSSTRDGKSFVKNITVEQGYVSAAMIVSPNEKTVGSLTEKFKVTVISSAKWNISIDSDWLSIDKSTGDGDATITVSVTNNNTSKERAGVITFYTESEGDKREFRTVTVTQRIDEYYLEVPNTEYLMPKESGLLEVRYLLSGANCTIEASSNATWITPSVHDGYISVAIAENTTSKERIAILSINTVGQSGAPIVKEVTITQTATDNILDILVSEITLNPMGETYFVVLQTNTEFGIHTTSSWFTAIKSGDGIEVSADMNLTNAAREGHITVYVTNTSGEQKSKVIKVTQSNADIKFETLPEKIVFSYNMGITNASLISTIGLWTLTNQDLPSWLTVSHISGAEGTTPIQISVVRNNYVRERSYELIFKNSLTGQTAILSVQQTKDPAIALADYKYLGMGYDAAGEYAIDRYVRAQIFDWRKLEEKNYLAGVTSHNTTTESRIYGKTIEEYQNNMSVNAGISGNYSGFSASVKVSYSKEAYSSAENEFSTFRSVTQKQSVQLHNNITAEDLMECLTDDFKRDIETMSPDNLFKKYGTHVIGGFIMGGSLDYSMTADRSSMSTIVDWGVAVEAGYSSASAGINVSAAYNQYDATKKESSNFEEKLLVRGGQSQNASSFGTPEAHNAWLASLSEPNTWVLVDYYGPKLYNIWDFAGDRKDKIQAAAEAWLEAEPFTQESTHKTLQIYADYMYILMEDTAVPTDNHTEIRHTMHITVPPQAEQQFSINYSQNNLLEYNNRNAGVQSLVRTDHQTSVYNLSKLKTHTITLRIDGFEWGQLPSESNRPFSANVTFTYNRETGRWKGDMFNLPSGYDNMTVSNPTDWSDGTTTIYVKCTGGGTSSGAERMVYRFRFIWN